MNKEEMINIANLLSDYLAEKRTFVENPVRMVEVSAATEIACELFPTAKIQLEDDPLQLGAIILTIKDFDLVVRETEIFAEMIVNADNFEIVYRNDKVELAILFNHALTQI